MSINITNKQKKVMQVITTVILIVSLYFLSSNITGFSVSNLKQLNSNFIGVALFISGLIIFFMTNNQTTIDDKVLSPVYVIRGEDRNEAAAFALAPKACEELKRRGYDARLVTIPLSQSPYAFMQGKEPVDYGSSKMRDFRQSMYLKIWENDPNAIIVKFHNSVDSDETFTCSLWGEILIESPSLRKPMKNESVLEYGRKRYLGRSDEDDERKRDYFDNVADVPATMKRYGKEKLVKDAVDQVEEIVKINKKTREENKKGYEEMTQKGLQHLRKKTNIRFEHEWLKL